jgi:hypothetical protein
MPALRTSWVKPVSALKGGDDPHARRRRVLGLIAAQVAFCVVVLFLASLFTATFKHLSIDRWAFLQIGSCFFGYCDATSAAGGSMGRDG